MDSKPANSVNYDRQLDDESASECELKIDIPSSEPDALSPTSDDQQKTQLGSDSQRESIDSGTFSEQEEEMGSVEIDVEASDDVSTNSLPPRKDSSIQANSYDTATSAQSAPRLHRRDSRFFITRWPTYLHPPFELSNYRLAVPNYIEHYIAAMSSAATAVQVPATMLARASSTPYSPAHSPHSNGLHVPEESAGSDKPLDFSSKPNSAASKTPPSSEEAELAISSRGGPAPPRIDPITLTKSLAAAAAASAYFPSHPKYIKNEHCFSTPSPSPPERTQHHFGLSVSGDAQSPHGPSTPMAANPEDHAAAAAAATNATAALANAQMFGLLSQFASAAQQHPNPMLSPALANQSTLLKAIQLASGGSSQQHQQQAALLSALMQSGANLELLKSLTAGATAPTMHQPQQSSPKLASPVATSNHTGAFLMAAQSATTTTVTPSHMSPAMGLLSTARHGAGYHHQSGPLSPPTSSAPVVEHSSNVFRSSPPSTVASNAKYTRPFKALYSGKDSFHAQSPFTPSIGLASAAATAPSVATDSLATQSILLSNSDLAYQEFRNKMLLSKTRTNERERNSSTHQTRASAGRDGKMAELMHQHSDDNHSVASSNSSDGLDCVSAGSDSQHQQHHFSTAASVSFPASSSSISIATSSSQMAHSTPHSATTAPTTPANTCNGAASSTGSNSGRKRGRPLPDDLKDEAYWERRRKNNEAAKRSRDLRRAKEDEIAIRAAFLEQENFKLKCELVQARIECDKIRALWLNTQQGQAAAAAGAQLSPSTITADQATLAAMLQMKTAGSPK